MRNTRSTRNGWKRGTGLAALAACATLALVACGSDGGGSIADQTKENESKAAEAGDCGDLNMAVNPWVGMEASSYVVGTVAQEQLGQGQLQGPQGGRVLAGLRHR